VLVLFRRGQVIQRHRGGRNDNVTTLIPSNKMDGGATRSTTTRYGESQDGSGDTRSS